MIPTWVFVVYILCTMIWLWIAYSFGKINGQQAAAKEFKCCLDELNEKYDELERYMKQCNDLADSIITILPKVKKNELH